ncbi:uncharacterized protein [Fopius arisanus]|uniref:RanBP-type and C3HC4-type zinc finger-containing protein 1 n=1 Tax=Fopius arisanus TaxID=64838 RepID=A0A9R1TLC0_9HYME|nr:PREDICTED: uncharacterized protein LOC105272431 [Fopius arisanus]
MVELNDCSGEECSLSSARSGASPRFSIFKWFKRWPKPQDNPITSINNGEESVFSSSDSIDTFYSTATVRSFAFQASPPGAPIHQIDIKSQDPTKVGPFGDGAVRIIEKDASKLTLNVATTLPANVLRRRDITARYSLQTCTGAFGSCGNISHQRTSIKRGEERGNVRRVHVRGKRRAPNPPGRPRSLCEVQGSGILGAGKRKRRPAPKPPVHLVKKRDIGMDGERSQGTGQSIFGEGEGSRGSDCGAESKIIEGKVRSSDQEIPSVSTDTLVLRGGVLLPKKQVSSASGQVVGQSTAMPRPWYKRNVFEYSSVNKECSNNVAVVAAVDSSKGNEEGSIRHFFTRSDRTKERKRDIKRQSGLSILTNISELDKEAAAIVQEEQAKSRAAMLLEASRLGEIERRIDGNEGVVQDMVTSVMENSPRRGTRALISKFNAIGNITRVTVNTSFFAKRDGNKADPGEDWRRRRISEGSGGDKDLSKYFRSHREGGAAEKSSPKFGRDTRRALNAERTAFFTSHLGEGQRTTTTSTTTTTTTTTRDSLKSGKSCPVMDVSNRLSALQDIIKKHSSPISPRSSTSSIGTPRDDENSSGSFSNSPKLDGSGVTEHRDTRTEKFDEVKTSAEVIQREFSQIFEEIDRQLSTSKLKLEQRRLVDGRNFKNSDSSNQVSKVLDILVEAENLRKSERQERKDKFERTIATSEDKVVDLKEMLKEMKHSLPKRPKPKRTEELKAIPSTSRLLEPVKVMAPPVLQMAPKSPKIERQKVSFGVQTSGNLRRVDTPRREVEKRPSGLNGKTFHLMRPREFAAIEAIMTMNNNQEENTYANVVEQSIYANAMVLPSRTHQEVGPHRKTRSTPPPHIQLLGSTADRLLIQLEEAVASKNHLQTTGFAKELTKLEMPCPDVFNVNMFIEDRLAQQGPIPLQLPVTMRIGELKDKISQEFEIPPNLQRWIIAKKSADDDNSTLQELDAKEGLPIFLYLAAPVLQIDNETVPAVVALEDDKIKEIQEEVDMPIVEESSDDEEAHVIPEIVTMDNLAIPGTSKIHDEPVEDDNDVEKQEEKIAAIEIEPGNEKTEAKGEIILSHTDTDCNGEGAVGIIESAKMEYSELMMLEKCGLVPNINTIECPICFITYGPLEGVVLRDCLHTFCRACIENTIKHCTEAEIKCPYIDFEYTCESTLQEREIKALVSLDVYEQHLAKSISQAENNAGHNAFHCKTPDCPGWCIIDDDVNNFLCPVCDSTNCLTCRVIHNGKNCWEYQEDVRLFTDTDEGARRTAEMLRDMLDSGEAMTCPTCAVVIMKKWGCDWIRCSVCKTEICWVTRGPRWGPGGKGDTSGGCRCNPAGKCHPRCNYCH